jgi:hypothetical protein
MLKKILLIGTLSISTQAMALNYACPNNSGGVNFHSWNTSLGPYLYWVQTGNNCSVVPSGPIAPRDLFTNGDIETFETTDTFYEDQIEKETYKDQYLDADTRTDNK